MFVCRPVDANKQPTLGFNPVVNIVQGASARAQSHSMSIVTLGQSRAFEDEHDGLGTCPVIRRSSCEMRVLVDRCGLRVPRVIGRQGLVRSASVCSDEACRNVRQMAPLVILHERVLAVQTRRSELQHHSVVKRVVTRPVGSELRFMIRGIVSAGPLELVVVSGSTAATRTCSTCRK